MAEFNPITDLMPMDSSEESVDESSEQIKVIRTQLIETRNSVANVLNIIKTKNSLLDRDLDKIKSLNDRLQRTIPRIPIMRGKAGVQFGDTIEEEKKKGGLNIPMLPPRPREKVVTYARPGVKQALDVVGNIINIITVAGSIRGLFAKPKVRVKPQANTIKPFIRERVKEKPTEVPTFFQRIFFGTKSSKASKVTKKTKGKVIEGDASQRTVDVDYEVVSDEPILTRLSNLFKARKLKKSSKEKGFAQFSKRADKLLLETKVPFELRPYDTKLEVNRYVTQLQRATTGKTNVKYPDFNSVENLFLSNRGDLNVMLRQRNAKLKNLTPGTEDYKNMQNSIKFVERGLKRVNKAFEKYLNRVDAQIRQAERLDRQNRNIIKRMLNKANREAKDFFKLPKSQREKIIKNRKEADELLEKIQSGGEDYVPNDQLNFETFRYNKNKSRVNAKSMNNDLAMLNTDTGVTNYVFFITDQA